MSKKPFLLIGSGSDIVGRGLAERINAGEFGPVGRVNRLYGDIADVGTRTDILFSYKHDLFWKHDFEKRGEEPLPYDGYVNPHCYDNGMLEVRCRAHSKVQHPSTGLLAIYYLIENGYFPTIIGYGFRDGVLVNPIKTYPDGRQEKVASYHSFKWENKDLVKLQEEGLIRLL